MRSPTAPGRTPVTPPSAYGAAWRDRVARRARPTPADALRLAAGDAVVVVAAHPDDETLGLGASLAQLAVEGVRLHVVSLTAGEAALDHVGVHPPGLAARRREEFGRAARRLGAASWHVVGLPDGRLGTHLDEASAAVAGLVAEHSACHVVSVWRGDPHPDHQAAGQASAHAADRMSVPLSEYAVWAPHWLDPAEVETEFVVPGVTVQAREARAAALAEYSSQTRPLADGVDAVLPPDALSWADELVVHR